MEGMSLAMIDPPHPGHSIRENCLEPLGLCVTKAARVLGLARHTLSRALKGHAAISPEMALRLEMTGWSNAEFWLRRQTTYDPYDFVQVARTRTVSMSNDTGRSPRCEASDNRFLLAKAKGGIGGKLGESYASNGPVQLPQRHGNQSIKVRWEALGAQHAGRPVRLLPMVLLVHGSPWERDVWGLDRWHQLLANRGHAVLSANFRASAGFGKKFLNADNLEWGGKMHDDLLDGVRWAID